MSLATTRSDGDAPAADSATRRTHLLVVIGVALIGVPLALTLYLSLFDEKLILFPPRGYTLSWYPAIIPNFGGPLLTSLELAVLAVAGSLLLGVPAGIALSRSRTKLTGAIGTLLLAPITFPGIALAWRSTSSWS